MEDMIGFLMAWWLGVTTVAAQTVTWGGDHVRLDMSRSGAELEFDCATGTITGALPETDGTFSLKGTLTPERGGPTRDGETSRIDATYSGTIKNDTMSLRIVLAGADRDKDGESVTYVLVKGRAGKLMKCR
jgi:hypothetical protein